MASTSNQGKINAPNSSSPSRLNSNSSQQSILDIGRAFSQQQMLPSTSPTTITSTSTIRPTIIFPTDPSLGDSKGKGVKRGRSQCSINFSSSSDVEIMEEIDSSDEEEIKSRLIIIAQDLSNEQVQKKAETMEGIKTNDGKGGSKFSLPLPIPINGVGISLGLRLPQPSNNSNPFKFNRPSTPPPLQTVDSSILIISPDTSPSKPSLPPSSALSPGRRTHLEIQARKLAAQEKLRKTKEEKARDTALAKALANERFATSQLEAYGLGGSSGGTVYGTGKGGRDKIQPTDGIKLDWKPHESCSPEQILVLEKIRSGGNVFFTGSAGTGKSFLLKEVTRLLDHIQRPYQLTATTGIAALQVGGCTLHSFAGVGLGEDSVLTLFDKFQVGKGKWKNWVETKVLIIDEVSMISPIFFTKLSLLGKLLRENNSPFGGMQVIISGDFFQLPPVINDSKPLACHRCEGQHLDKIRPENSTLAYEELAPGMKQPYEILKCSDARRNGESERGCGLEFRARKFAFETNTWAECRFEVMELTKVFRQSDLQFVKMLEKFRRGFCDEECISLIKSCGSALNGEIKIKPTNLYPTRAKVTRENNSEFEKLVDPSYSFEALDSHYGPRGKELMASRLKDVPPERSLKLKKGAQVMLLTNLSIESGLVNGSRGVIVDWKTASECPPPPSTSGSKSDRFGGEEWRLKAAEEWADDQVETIYPEVYFACGITRVIRPHTWAVDIDKQNSVARSNLPLALAWALTIHKSQGQSLDAVAVHLDQTFEKGMAYVALSRARTPAGMLVTGFRPSHIMASPTVKVFYDRIAESKPFFVSPVVPENPLLYIPEHSPLLDRLHRLFGEVPPPLPLGSALPPSNWNLALNPIPIRRPALENDTHGATFEALLQQAAETYFQNGSRDLVTFVEKAKKSLEILLEKEKLENEGKEGKIEAGLVKQEDAMDVDVAEEDVKPLPVVKNEVVTEEEVLEAAALSRTTSVEAIGDVREDGVGGSETVLQKKTKKIRRRGKRVGS